MEESYKAIILDFSKEPEKKVPNLKQYEIWTGPHGSTGTGDDGYTESRYWGSERASTFELACLKHELRQMLNNIESMDNAGEYVDNQSKEWFYNWQTNSNSWIGKYYPSKQEADRSLPW